MGILVSWVPLESIDKEKIVDYFASKSLSILDSKEAEKASPLLQNGWFFEAKWFLLVAITMHFIG